MLPAAAAAVVAAPVLENRQFQRRGRHDSAMMTAGRALSSENAASRTLSGVLVLSARELSS
jgi:hypothetical protein